MKKGTHVYGQTAPPPRMARGGALIIAVVLLALWLLIEGLVRLMV